mgnify:CR=1 FL=1
MVMMFVIANVVTITTPCVALTMSSLLKFGETVIEYGASLALAAVAEPVRTVFQCELSLIHI